MPIVDDDCGSIVNCLSLKFMLMNFHIDLSIHACVWVGEYTCVCLAYWRSQSAMHQPQEKREIITAKKNIKYNLISCYAKVRIYTNCIKTGRGRCSARIYWNYPYKLGEGCHQLVSLKKGVNCLQISPGRLSSQDVAQLDVAAAEKIYEIQYKSVAYISEKGRLLLLSFFLLYVAKYLLSCLTACRMRRSTLVPHKC